MIRDFLEWALSVLFPPKVPKIRSKRELWESWISREAPVHHPELDPQRPLRRWESWAGHIVERTPIPKYRRYFQDK